MAVLQSLVITEWNVQQRQQPSVSGGGGGGGTVQ